MKSNRFTDLLPNENYPGLPDLIFCQLESDYHQEEQLLTIEELWTTDIHNVIDLVSDHS